MKHRIFIMKNMLALLLLICPLAIAYADAPMFMGYNNGKNYVKLFSDNQRATYAQGLINGITLHNIFNDQTFYNNFMQCTAHLKAGEIGEIIKRYIVDHPEQQQKNLNILSLYALNEVCIRMKNR